jgi:ATP-dependent helicase HrpA
VIITSATIDPQRFSRHFNKAPVIEVSGRTYPVEVRYRPLFVDKKAVIRAKGWRSATSCRGSSMRWKSWPARGSGTSSSS